MRTFVVVAVLALVALGGCADDNSWGTAAPAHVPSAAARLACGTDAASDITTSLGVGVTAPVRPVSAGSRTSCEFVFAAGTMMLSVADHPSAAAASAAFARSRPPGAAAVPGLGQQAYALDDGTTVVRKDASVLTVDVSGLPATFGVPPHPRNLDAITVAGTVLACWTEDGQ